jgi:SAM-dependent MidA family methyltransferase
VVGSRRLPSNLSCSHHYAIAQEGQPLKIVEIGGGNGTLARDILVRHKYTRQLLSNLGAASRREFTTTGSCW